MGFIGNIIDKSTIHMEYIKRVCQGCVKGVFRVYEGCVKGVFRVCQGCVKGVFRVCQGCVNSHRESGEVYHRSIQPHRIIQS